MTIRTSPWPAGIPCWTDLQTPDVQAAAAFYGRVLGWSFMFDDENQWGGYAIAQKRDVAAAGLGPQMSPGVPSAWTLYFASDDADKTAATIAENGGTVVVPAGDVGPLGRMLVAMDPTGAAFAVWQAKEHIGANIVNEPGGIAWEDLRSPDPDTARTFYQAVFGYETHHLEMAGPTYTTFHQPGERAPLGGMGGMMGQDDAPPHWLVYFCVEDAAAAQAEAVAAGGTVVQEHFDSPFGPMAGLLDPFGALFWVAQVSPDQPQPDRAG